MSFRSAPEVGSRPALHNRSPSFASPTWPCSRSSCMKSSNVSFWIASCSRCCASPLALSHSIPVRGTQSPVTALAPAQSPLNLCHDSFMDLPSPGCSRSLPLAVRVRLRIHSCSQCLDTHDQRSSAPCASLSLSPPLEAPCGLFRLLNPSVTLSTPPFVGVSLAMTTAFLLQGVVRSRDKRAVLSPRPPTSARMRRTVPSLGSRIRHVCSPARCVPILSCLRMSPPQVWAAVIEEIPQAVSPILPEIGHHLCRQSVGVLTSLPM